MNAYLPSEVFPVGGAAVVLAVVLCGGWLVSWLKEPALRRGSGWLLAVGSVVAMERLTADEPPGWRMLLLILTLFWAMKGIVYAEWFGARPQGLPVGRRLLFWLAWPGMRPDVFDKRSPSDHVAARSWIVRGGLSLAAGAALLRVVTQSAVRESVAVWAALPGLSLMLHFGLFAVLAGAWRNRGFRTYELFRAPLRSRSLEEFWGRRWNLAFSEMTSLAVFRPLCGVIPRTGAAVAAFLFSGALHELAISVPVRAGYGLPMLYFLLQGVGLILERRFLPQSSWGRRLWTAAWILLPLPLVFHSTFLQGIVAPLIGHT